MNEIMMPDSLGVSFSFSKPQLNHSTMCTQSEDMNMDNHRSDNQSALFDYKFGVTKIKEACESFSEDSVLCNSHDTFGNISKNTDMKESLIKGVVDSDTSSAEYEIVSLNVENTTKTTVINTTYNLVSEASVKNTNKNESVENSVQNIDSSTYDLSNGFDKSRVVVQVLTSKQNVKNCIKSDAVVEKKFPQSPSSCSFRDDIFNILGKVRPAHSATEMRCNGRSMLSEKDAAVNRRKFVKISSPFNRSNHSKTKIDKKNHVQLTSQYNSSNQWRRSIQTNKDVNERNAARISSQKKCSDENKRSIQTEEDAFENKKRFVDITSQCESSNRVVKSGSNLSNLQFDFESGKGKKLGEIDFVANSMQNASANLLRILHYVLFDTYGPCNSSVQLSQTRQNILFFCGYPFAYNSEIYMKKKNCLLRLPFPILLEMYKTVIGKDSNNRAEMVAQLVDFFMKPTDYELETDCHQDSLMDSNDDYVYMKLVALKEPLPIIPVKNLTNEDVEELKQQIKLKGIQGEDQADTSGDLSCNSLPPYILNGPGLKLKTLLNIVRYVKQTKSPILGTLHYLLYGRYESSVATCRKNILEFSGFLPCQKEFIAQRQTLLNSMGHLELLQLCKILCLNARTNNKSLRIKKIINFLSDPRKPMKYRCKKYLNKFRTICKKKVDSTVKSTAKYEKPCYDSKKESTDGPKLRDFRKISSNIECASPSDLTELNDLLFIKPCDESEIHQKILDFSQFDFLVNSMEFHFRKTLMHYMNFCIIKKIAQLLDIENWEKASCQADLSLSILNFLMEMKDNHPQRKLPFRPATYNKNSVKTKSSGKSKSQILQIYEQKTEESWCLQTSPKSQQDHSSSLDNLYSSENSPVSNQAIRTVKKNVFIHRLSKSTVKEDSRESNDALSDMSSPKKSHQSDDDSVPLRALLHHPSDYELQEIITKIIKSDLWTLTMGNLVQKVYDFYPDLNLCYRENFIKTEARLILSQLRSNAVDTINSIQCTLSDVI